MARYRGTTAQRGLGGDHQADKKRLKALHRDGDPCWRCGQPMYKWQDLDRDHIVDRALGGANGPAVLAHASCNRSAGARLSNQIRPQGTTGSATAGRDTICRTCGKRYWYSARPCEICGAHYHPHYSGQRSCSRACGVVLRRRRYGYAGSKAPAPKPLCAQCGKPCNAGTKFCSRTCATVASAPAQPRATPITYYTCRYCGKLGVTNANRKQQREVCPARACQLARLAANNLRTRHGLSKEDADAQMAATVGYRDWQQARQW
jgi:hypothetical protein